MSYDPCHVTEVLATSAQLPCPPTSLRHLGSPSDPSHLCSPAHVDGQTPLLVRRNDLPDNREDRPPRLPPDSPLGDAAKPVGYDRWLDARHADRWFPHVCCATGDRNLQR